MSLFKKIPTPVFGVLMAAKTLTLLAMFLLAGCTTAPTVRVDQEPAARLSSYRTFSFYNHLSTDKPSYSSIMSSHLKQATRAELERHGYVYDERNPDLRVNFDVRIADRQELRSYPTSGGVFLRRAGVSDYNLVNYRQGTVSIDIVDAKRESLLWQGIADGRVDDKAMENPGKAIDTVVKHIFLGFPLSQK
jgi:hypothetical protein